MFKFYSKNKYETTRGYTIVETMIVVTIFIVVITIGMGALLNANLVYQKSQDMRSILDNLSFVMEDISRSLRIGSEYHCIDDGILNAVDPHSCATGTGISFKSFNGDRLIYFIDSADSSVKKSINSGPDIALTIPPEIKINSFTSYLTVSGAELLDAKQPFVTIRLVGTITYKGVISSFSLQTSVSQRLIDIP